MRQLIFLAVLFQSPLIISAQPLPEWYRVYTFDDSTIEMNTLVVTRISDDVSRVRFRWTFNEPQSLRETPTIKYLSNLEVIEFNCTQKSYRPYHVTYFDETGKMIQIYDSPGKWSLASRGMMEKLMVPACELIKKQKTAAVDETNYRVASLAHDFFKQLERSDDFRSLINQYFSSNYLDGYLKDKNRNWFLNLDRNLATKLSRSELERFYLASMSAGYVTWMYLISKHSSGSERYEYDLNLIPVEVVNMIRRHAYTAKFGTGANFDFLADKIDSLEKARLYTDLLENIRGLMQARVKKENVVKISAWRDLEHENQYFAPRERKCHENCLGLPEGTKLFEVDAPVITLQIAELNGSLKVISARFSF